jgi:hypothetical protein
VISFFYENEPLGSGRPSLNKKLRGSESSGARESISGMLAKKKSPGFR